LAAPKSKPSSTTMRAATAAISDFKLSIAPYFAFNTAA
jgi:hypothetical protein